MFGHIIGTVLVVFLCSFAIGTTIMVIKELIARKRAKASEEAESDVKEVDSSN